MYKIQSQRFEALVWTVRVDAAASTMAVQLRNGETKWAGYCLIELNSGLVGPIIAVENGWWTELLGISGNQIRIGRYGDAALPVISEEFAIDGKEAAVSPNFEGNSEEDLNQMLIPQMVPTEAISLSPAPIPNSWIAELLFEQLQIRAWHVSTANGAALRIGIWVASELKWEVVLEENMDKLNPSPFFVAGKWLIFIRERMELCWIDLTEIAAQS